jgi:CPA1 family monovalent cation:H+ antiporter
MQKTLQHWEEKSKTADDSVMNEKTRSIFLEILESQREYLKNLNKDPLVNEEKIRSQLYQIDLEEERLKIL